MFAAIYPLVLSFYSAITSCNFSLNLTSLMRDKFLCYHFSSTDKLAHNHGLNVVDTRKAKLKHMAESPTNEIRNLVKYGIEPVKILQIVEDVCQQSCYCFYC